MPDDAEHPLGHRRRWSGNWLLRDAAAFLPVTALVVAGGFALSGAASVVQAQIQQMAVLLAVAATVAAALMVGFAGRLDRDVTALRIGSGLLVYGGVVLPVSSAGFTTSIGPVGRMLELLALGAVAVLFALGLVRRGGEPRLAWPAAAVSVAASLAVVAGTALAPALVPGPATLTGVHSVIVVGMGVVAVALVTQGMRERSVLQRRVGLGYGLLAVAHGGRGLESVEAVMTWPTFTGLRPVAVALVVAGVVPHLRAALRRQHDRDVAALRLRAEREAGAARERDADDRDHELRNVVLGLSGAAALLAGPSDGERAELGAAVAAELTRLTRMLDRTRPEAGTFDVRRALGTAVSVRRATGAVIELDVPDGLRARGSAEILTQVVTNLLVNCARHAPGSTVRVSASAVGDRVVVLVRDHGPGIPPDMPADALLDRGHRSSTSDGRGLGLGISRDLLRAHDGELRIVRPAGRGCLAVLEIPVAGAAVAGLAS